MVKFAVFGGSFVARLNTYENSRRVQFFWLRRNEGGKCVRQLISKTKVVYTRCCIHSYDISKDSSCKTICENIQSLVGEIYKAGAKVVFVAEICQRGNFTKASGLTFCEI